MALALLYLAGPVLIMAELLSPALSIPGLLLCLFWLREFQLYLFPAGRIAERWAGVSWRAITAAGLSFFLLAALWLLASGVGSFAYCRFDYVKHNFVFASLLASHLPIIADPGDGTTAFLHYYFAYYIVPVRLYQGLHLLLPPLRLDHVIVVVYGLALLGSLRVISQNLRISALELLLVMVFAGGLDIVGRILFGTEWQVVGHVAGLPVFKDLDWWGMPLAPQSLTMNLFWAPQHFFAALIGTALLCCILAQPRAWQAKCLHAACIVTVSAFWSPYVAVGLAVVVLGAMGRLLYRSDFSQNPRMALSWKLNPRFLGAAAFVLFLAVFVVIFFAAAKPASPPSLIFFHASFGDWFLSLVIRLAPALLVLTLLALNRGKLTSTDGKDLFRAIGFLVAAVALLLCFTHGIYDDWAMRTTLPASILLAAAFCRFLGEGIGHLAKAVLVAVLVLTSASSLNEIAQSAFVFPHGCASYGAYSWRDLGPLAWQYEGRNDSLLYRWLSR